MTGRYNAADVRIVRFILVALLSVSMLATLAAAQPHKCEDTAAVKSCCAKHQDSQQGPGKSDDASRPTCVMACCQALHVVPSNAVRLDASDDVRPTQLLARPVLHSVAEINSIFHPPRV
jgi:hypothetical protein